ncbi:MAG: hypothetical protein HUU45_05325 [Leptospiraceae bacterium]|nr:hypothetical protein [Leptospiraceae bacterium]
MIANSKNEVKAKLQSAAPGNLPLEEIPTSEYLDARKTYPLVMAAPSININALNKNVSALNDQMLARCRSTKDWTRMMQVKNSARTSLYFHYTNERILNSKTVIRLDVKTGDVQTFDTKDDLFSDKSGGPSLVVNATDANGDLLIDNAAILFERHQTKCRDAYGYLRASLSPFNPDVDAEASSLLESYLEREPTSWRPNFPGTLLPDTVSLSWFNKDISTQDKQYIKPDPYADSYWNK